MYVFIALGIIAALGALWWSLSGETPTNSLLTTQSANGGVPGDKELVDTLLQLRAVSLSGTIFLDPSFMILRDFGTQIVPEPVGRPNPFLPLTSRPTSTKAAGTLLFTPPRR